MPVPGEAAQVQFAVLQVGRIAGWVQLGSACPELEGVADQRAAETAE